MSNGYYLAEKRFGYLDHNNEVVTFHWSDPVFEQKCAGERWSVTTMVGCCEVRTVFLGFLHFPDIWFQTTVHCDHRAKTITKRYQNYQQAMSGHEEQVQEISGDNYIFTDHTKLNAKGQIVHNRPRRVS